MLYTYSIENDTLKGFINLVSLRHSIISDIPVTLKTITTTPDIKIIFAQALDASQKSDLDNIVANHDPDKIFIKRHICLDKEFLNAGSADMIVDGSVTEVEFTTEPPAGEIWFVDSLNILISDQGSTDLVDFGAISNGLSNGFQILQKIDDTEYELGNYKSNSRLARSFVKDSTISTGTMGWLNAGDFFTGSMEINDPIILVGSNGDKLIAKVRDDLTGLLVLSLSAGIRRKL